MKINNLHISLNKEEIDYLKSKEWFKDNIIQTKDDENITDILVDKGILSLYLYDDKSIELSLSDIGKQVHKHLIEQFEWTDEKVIDFVNEYIKLHELDFRYTLENKHIIDTFKEYNNLDIWKK